MTITSPNSVLLLGAGVSKPFGIPLGGEMLEEIHEGIAKERSALFRVHGQAVQLLNAAATSSVTFKRFPYCGVIARDFLRKSGAENPLDEALNSLERFQHLLKNQTSETIDDFIVENPTCARLAKLAIATRLFAGCYSIEEGGCHLRPLDRRKTPDGDERNWIHLLINIIRHGIRNGEVSSERKISIVTFNYDRILEHVLETQFSNTESNYGRFASYVDIHHVHGACGALTQRADNAQEVIADWANGIHVVNEKTTIPEIDSARNAARTLIKNASEIYAAGFSFAGPNRRLLGMENLMGNAMANTTRTLYFCNYDGNIGVSRGAHRCLVGSQTEVVEDKGDRIAGLSVVDWIRAGSLGELPG